VSVGFSFLTKDPELSRLRALVEYLREISDEFVFTIDDRTPQWVFEEIGSWPGVTVVGYTWNDDFSDARNYGLKWIKSDWTCYFDPDELPNARLLEFIRVVSNQTDGPIGYLFDTHNFWGGKNNVFHQESDWHLRLWRSGRGKFYKKVHEQVALNGKQEHATRSTSLVQKAPHDAFIIHAKPGDRINDDTNLYSELEKK